MLPQVQTPNEFLQQFHELIQRAEYRIYMQSMNFESGEVFDHFTPVLIAKAKAGVDVRLHIDWVAKRYTHERLFFFPSFHAEERLRRKNVIEKFNILREKLLDAGIRFIEINRPTPLGRVVPILGRNHKKMYLVDEKAAWIGGVNFADHAFRNIDCMLKMTDPAFIQTLAEQFNLQESTRDDEVKSFGDDYRLLIDGGKRGSSVIYQTAMDMVKESEKSIIFISQFLPDGPLLDMLIKKHMQGIPVIVMTSPEKTKGFHTLPYKYVFQKSRKVLEDRGIHIHFLTERVHAKIIFVDGKTVLIGSHNLVNIGVQLGTAEIALWATNHTFINRFREFLYAHVFKYEENLFFGDSLPFFV